jgi:excisionase family DNA binding protein
MTITAPERSVLLTRPAERQQAVDLLSVIDGHVERLAVAGAPNAPVPVPTELAQIITKVLEAMAAGGTVTIGSLPEELTTTVAADQLGISRPTLMKMIRSGEIPAHKVGAHHRLKTVDVLAVKRIRLAKQREAFVELRRLEDELEGL